MQINWEKLRRCKLKQNDLMNIIRSKSVIVPIIATKCLFLLFSHQYHSFEKCNFSSNHLHQIEDSIWDKDIWHLHNIDIFILKYDEFCPRLTSKLQEGEFQAEILSNLRNML